MNNLSWAYNVGATNADDGTVHTILPEHDYDYSHKGFRWTGAPILVKNKKTNDTTGTVNSQGATAYSGSNPSAHFAMAIDLETSNGLEISGLNAEEQSDISLIARYSASQQAGFVYNVFTYIDAMIVLRENNVLELIE